MLSVTDAKEITDLNGITNSTYNTQLLTLLHLELSILSVPH